MVARWAFVSRSHTGYVLDSDFVLEYVTDIAEAFPDKTVTLLHSRNQLLPKFDIKMHNQSMPVSILAREP